MMQENIIYANYTVGKGKTKHKRNLPVIKLKEKKHQGSEKIEREGGSQAPRLAISIQFSISKSKSIAKGKNSKREGELR